MDQVMCQCWGKQPAVSDLAVVMLGTRRKMTRDDMPEEVRASMSEEALDRMLETMNNAPPPQDD